jgi:DNA-binding MurR/RpiR family transcriptional regulator
MITPVLEQPRPYVLLSLRDLSCKLNCDPATVLRTVQALGFKRYREFQEYLHERSIAFSTSFDALEQAGDRGTGLDATVRKSIKRDIDNLRQLRNTLDPARLIAIAKKFYRARRILVLAGDMATTLARFLDYNLAMLGLNVVCVVQAGDIRHRVQHVGKRDVALAISFGRGLHQTVEGFKCARENGAYCIGVSDTYLSPLFRFADEFFVTPTDRLSFADSYVAGMAFLNALLVACANIRRRRTMAVLKKAAEEQRTGGRWYTEQK